MRFLPLLAPVLLAACRATVHVPAEGEAPVVRRTVEADFEATWRAVEALLAGGEVEIPSMRVRGSEVRALDAERGEVSGFLTVGFREGLEGPGDDLERFADFGTFERGERSWRAAPDVMRPGTRRTVGVFYAVAVCPRGPRSQDVSMRTEWSQISMGGTGFLGDAIRVVTGLSTGLVEEAVLEQIARRAEPR